MVGSPRKSNRITRRRNKNHIVGGAKPDAVNESNNLNPFKFLTGNMMSDIKKGYERSKEFLEQAALDAKDKVEEAYEARENEVKDTYYEVRDKVKRDVKKGIKEAKDKKDSFLCNKAVELMNESNIAKFDNIDCGGADKQGETLGKRVKGQAPGRGQGQAPGKGGKTPEWGRVKQYKGAGRVPKGAGSSTRKGAGSSTWKGAGSSTKKRKGKTLILSQ